jgi:probable F420-dependent oxidoreductase
VRFGLNVVPVHPAEVAAVGARAEELGFESLWIGEHVATPVELPGYPGSTREPPFRPDSRFMEPFTTIGHLAAVTSRVRLGTAVLIMPLHPLLPLARAIATADVLSGGRLSLGVGLGWLREEFAVVGQGFEDRGPRMEEMLVLLERLFTEERVAYEGEYHWLPEMGFAPKPVQLPRPPVLVGGTSRAALRRAARVGDGWFGTQDPPAVVAEAVAELHRLRAGYGRADTPFEVTVLAGWGQGYEADAVAAYAAAGVDRIVVTPWARSREARAGIERFARDAGLDAGVVTGA